MSLSARRAWIEISRSIASLMRIRSLSARRAWIEMRITTFDVIGNVSLSARRAWIEIERQSLLDPIPAVALRKESVDRNWKRSKSRTQLLRSLSARRAWIEMSNRV